MLYEIPPGYGVQALAYTTTAFDTRSPFVQILETTDDWSQSKVRHKLRSCYRVFISANQAILDLHVFSQRRLYVQTPSGYDVSIIEGYVLTYVWQAKPRIIVQIIK